MAHYWVSPAPDNPGRPSGLSLTLTTRSKRRPNARPDPDKLNNLMGKLVGDLGAAIAGAGILLGYRLGLYKAMADGKPVTSSELAEKTNRHERYVREWLSAQAASEYIDYQTDKNTFSLSAEKPWRRPTAPPQAFLPRQPSTLYRQHTWTNRRSPRPLRAGRGVGWHDHSKCLFSGDAECFFRPGYNANLVSSWYPGSRRC